MIGKKRRGQEELFLYCSLKDVVPDDYILKRVDKVLDLSWLRDEVRQCYCEDNGRPGIAPEAALRLMLAGCLLGIVHDRKLIREAQVNIAIRWFAGYRLQDTLPDHSSLTRIRQRWGEEKFRSVMVKVVEQCVKAGIVGGKTIHCDATLIRADVSWKSMTTEYVGEVLKENASGDDDGGAAQDDKPADKAGVGGGAATADGAQAAQEDKSGRKGRGRPKRRKQPKKRSLTDPDATLSTNDKRTRMEPSYKQHTAVDDKAGVIVDVEVTTGEVNEGKRLLGQVERVQEATGEAVETVTADKAYSSAENYSALEALEIEAVIPPQSAPKHRKRQHIPASRFKYDPMHDVVRCVRGKQLVRKYRGSKAGVWIYAAERKDCGGCPLRQCCVPPTGRVRTVAIAEGQESLLRARRRWRRKTARQRRLYNRHRWRVEGVHGEGKTQHGLRRAVRRGLPNVSIQSYLTAIAMNLKRLAALVFVIFRALWRQTRACRWPQRDLMRARGDWAPKADFSVAAA